MCQTTEINWVAAKTTTFFKDCHCLNGAGGQNVWRYSQGVIALV